MATNQIIAALQTVILGLIGSFLVTVIVKFYPKIDAFIVARIGRENSYKLYSFGWKAWYIVEEYFRTSQPVITKIEYFKSLMVAKYPLITEVEINNTRQAIAGEFNKDKAEVIKELDPTVATVIEKYVDKDGNELVKVVPTV